MSHRVLVQYNCIPHYRARLFELLSQQSDLHVTIVADDEADTPFLRTVRGGKERGIRRIDASTHLIRLPGGLVLSWQPTALSLMRRHQPDAVIALGSVYSLTAWALCLFGRLWNIPILLWGHGLLEEERGVKWWIRRALYRLASGHLLYGDHARDLLIKKGFSSHALTVVYNSLDYDLQTHIAATLDQDRIRALRESIGVKPGEGIVAFTGRLEPAKRLDFLVHAIGKLAKMGKRVHLVLIGEGREGRTLQQLAIEHECQELLHLLGASYDERFLGLVLGASDLSVIPSGAGLSVMHAMVFGTPVLLHDRHELNGPEWEAVEEGVTGFFYRYGDMEDMIAKIDAAIFPHPKKPSMSEACQRIIHDRYNPHRQVELFTEAVRHSVSAKAA